MAEINVLSDGDEQIRGCFKNLHLCSVLPDMN